MGAAVRTGRPMRLAALVLATLWAADASAERLLLQSPRAKVNLEREVACGEGVRLYVDANRPEVFDPGSGELQSLVDAARAMLTFECARLTGIEVQGWLTGMTDSVYSGRAGPEDQWHLLPDRTLRSVAAARAAPSPVAVPDADFSVVGLRLGMAVEEANGIVAERFGARPVFDPAAGVLSLQEAGCPDGYDWKLSRPYPEPGWKCLRVWFSQTGRDGSLAGLELVQVVSPAQLPVAMQALEDRFGSPAAQWSDAVGRPGLPARHLAWGEAKVGTARDSKSTAAYPLTASIVDRADANAAVVAIRLAHPGVPLGSSSASDFRL